MQANATPTSETSFLSKCIKKAKKNIRTGTHSYLGQDTCLYLGPVTHSYLGQDTCLYLGPVTHSYLGQDTCLYLGPAINCY